MTRYLSQNGRAMKLPSIKIIGLVEWNDGILKSASMIKNPTPPHPFTGQYFAHF